MNYSTSTEQELFMARVSRLVGHKRRRLSYKDIEPPVPLTFVWIIHGKITKKHRKHKPLRALVDSGISASIICKKQLHENKSYHSKEKKWQTTAGTVSTHGRSKLDFFLSEFSYSRKITHDFHVVNTVLPSYDMIVGRDLMHFLKLDMQFNTSSLNWHEHGSENC